MPGKGKSSTSSRVKPGKPEPVLTGPTNKLNTNPAMIRRRMAQALAKRKGPSPSRPGTPTTRGRKGK